MERKSAIAAKYLFPNFETAHWFAAKGLVLELKRYHERIIPPHILQGVRDLFKALKAWFDEYETRRAAIPDGVEPYALIKDLHKEIKLAEKFSRKMSKKSSVKSNVACMYVSADEQSKSSSDVNLAERTLNMTETRTSDSPVGSPGTQVRIKMKISRKSIDEWSPSPHTSEVSDKKLFIAEGGSTTHSENVSAHKYSLMEAAEENSLDCLYIDESTGNKSCKKWDSNNGVVSLDSQRRSRPKDVKSKHKKHTDEFLNQLRKHKHKYLSKDIHINNHSTDGLKTIAKNEKNVLLNDALAGALDGMEELIKSSNYAERVAQSQCTPVAVRETIVSLGAMTDSILPKTPHELDGEVLEIRHVYQDDDYIYLPLVGSDDESKNSQVSQKKKRTRDDDDETWSPSGKCGNVGTRNSKVTRQHAKRKSVEKGLMEAASRPLKIQVFCVDKLLGACHFFYFSANNQPQL
ncbi:unnamed protein product [Orchesella dallaii]|uniref:Jumonji helical domain-containing protein n=1 Tax=Orchesella dallaii TaxID=48710 RepID=A0ABP1Q354_9HEXA